MAETVLISGASGLVGKAAVKALRAHGYDVLRLVRKPVELPDEVSWSPGHVDLPADRVIDHVVHLAGEPVFGLWTKDKKKRIFESRVRGTRTITDFCTSRPKKPKTLISASAIGIYGNRGDEVLTEASPTGDGFLADVARSWEAAAEPARSLGIRVVHPRIGVVLSKDGGALSAMKLPFQLGLGGRLGSGEQWFSWITLDDLVQIIVTAIDDKQFSGAINCTAPEPVTNRDFVKVLSYVLNRPAIIPVPAFALKLLPGDMANEALLASERVIPQRLLDAGFKFKHPELLQALTSSLQLQL